MLQQQLMLNLFRKIILKRKYTNTYNSFAAHFERLDQERYPEDS